MLHDKNANLNFSYYSLLNSFNSIINYYEGIQNKNADFILFYQILFCGRLPINFND